jgi:hypothetical protein
MPFDLKLAPNGDLPLYGPLTSTDEPEMHLQAITRALKMHAGDWYLNTSEGLPWETWAGSKPTPVLEIQSRVRSTILAVDPRYTVLKIVVAPVGETVTIQAQVRIPSGEEITITGDSPSRRNANTWAWSALFARSRGP